PVVLADTAGLREAVDAIEAEGVRRATLWAKGADLRIVVGAADEWSALDASEVRRVVVEEATLVVANKTDLAFAPATWGGLTVLPVSVRSGTGLDGLVGQLERQVGRLAGESEEPAVTRARHRQGLQACIDAIDRSVSRSETDLRAEELRQAAQALGRLTGRIDVEDVLDVLFWTFCIGK